jgi:hypothetical protein
MISNNPSGYYSCTIEDSQSRDDHVVFSVLSSLAFSLSESIRFFSLITELNLFLF